MRFIIVFILIGSIYYNGFSQNDYKRINISKDITLIKLSENAYVHVSYADLPKFGRFPSNGLIFINGSDAFLFDTPVTDSLTMDLVSWIKDSMKLRIVGFVPNHWHNDCMGGLGYLQSQKIESYANQMTIDIAKTKNLPIPAHGFKDSLQLQLGDKLIRCYYLGAAHSLDNIVVWIPSEQILFAGCMVKSSNSKDLGNTSDGYLTAYPKTINKLIDRFPMAKIVIPGHGQFGGIELIKHTKELLTQ
ncbi:MAG: subclass B1 metallo-beta-lactamase [Bacteroidota bacterium]|nr:subclass B1 metallo-beta-lactamase [Bacteroidota bacterium]